MKSQHRHPQRLTKLIFFSLSFFASFEILAADEPGEVLGLRDSVNLALQKNPIVLESREKMKEGDALGMLAFSKVLPSISSTVQFNRQKDALNGTRPKFEGDSYNFYSGKVEGAQPLLQRGYFSAISAGRKESPLRGLDVEISERDLVYRVVQSFYTVLLNTHKIQTLRKAEGLYRQSLETAERRMKIGRGQRLDTLQAKTQMALIKPRIEKAENDLKTSAAELSNLLGDRQAKFVQIKGKLDPLPFLKIQEKLTGTKSKILEIEKSKLFIRQREDEQVVTLGKHWPQLNAVGNAERSGYKKGDLSDDDATAWSVGLQLKIPLFSGLSYFFEKNQTNSQIMQNRLDEQRLRDEFALKQVKSSQDLDSAESVIRSSKVAFDLAEESVKEAKSQYRVSNIDYTQLLTTEQNLQDSELAYDQAKYDYIVSLINYFTAWGYSSDILVESLEDRG